MDMYWWALVLGIVVLSVSFFLGKKKGFFNGLEDDPAYLADNQTTKSKIVQDRYEEQPNNSVKKDKNEN